MKKLKLDILIVHLAEAAKEHEGSSIGLLLEQAAFELATLRDDLAALHQQGSDHV